MILATDIQFGLLQQTLQAGMDRLPELQQILASWWLIVLLVVSVVIGLYGARLVRALIFAVCLGAGAWAGHRAAGWLGVPAWPAATAGGSLGGLVAYFFYSWCVALVSAVLLAAACCGWYVGTSLSKAEISSALVGDLAVGIQGEPAQADLSQRSALAGRRWLSERIARLWALAAEKVSIRRDLAIVALAGAGVGLLTGLLLPRLVVILWTSVLAAAGMGISVFGLLSIHRPHWAMVSADKYQHVLLVLAGIAAAFAVRQVFGRPVRPAAGESSVASSADKL